ncbi:MAG: sulfur carrier protein ThiS [Planctomycetota bacterium]|jgi:thiamine biosynthesis protein ThiS
MRIRINGDEKDLADTLTVADLLDQLALEPLRVAIERNRELVRRAEFAETWLADGDELEIVTLVGGG